MEQPGAGSGAGTTVPRPASSVRERGTGSRQYTQQNLPQPSRNAQAPNARPDEHLENRYRPQSPQSAFSWFLRVSFACGLVYLLAGSFGTH